MARSLTRQHYQRRFQALVDYIFDNLDSRLDLERLSEVACISSYHLHRLYRCYYGETLAETVRRIRLHYAAEALLNTDTTLDLIGKKAGYTSVQAFSRAFSKAFGEPPAAFRKRQNLVPFELEPRPAGSASPHGFHVSVTTLPVMRLWGIPHTGSFLDIGQSFEQLLMWLGTHQLFHPGLRLGGIYMNDPESVPPRELQSLAGAIGLEECQWPSDLTLECQTLPAGDYAVLRFKGPYNHLHDAYQWLFGQWLPQSGYEPGDAPVFEEYLNNPREVPPKDLLTDIHLSLKPMEHTEPRSLDRERLT